MIIKFVLKRFWRELLIVALGSAFALSVTKCSRVSSDNKLLLTANDSLYTVAQYHYNKNGDLVGRIRTYEGTITQFKAYVEQLGFDRQRLEKQVDNLNRLVSHWRGEVSAKDNIIIALRDTILHSTKDTINSNSVVVDTSTGKVFNWSNTFLELDGTIDPHSNQLSLQYKYNSEFSLTAYHKPQGLFKPKVIVTDIWFEDPNMKVREFKGFVVTQEKKPGFFRTPIGHMTIGFIGGVALSKIAQ